MKKSKPMNYRNVLFYTAQLQHLINTQMVQEAKANFISLENIKNQILSLPDQECGGVIFYSILVNPSQGEFKIGSCAIYPKVALEIINRIYSDNPVLLPDNVQSLSDMDVIIE